MEKFKDYLCNFSISKLISNHSTKSSKITVTLRQVFFWTSREKNEFCPVQADLNLFQLSFLNILFETFTIEIILTPLFCPTWFFFLFSFSPLMVFAWLGLVNTLQLADYARYPSAASSALVELTTRLHFFKERRSQLLEQLHNLDSSYGAKSQQEFAYRASSPAWNWWPNIQDCP